MTYQTFDIYHLCGNINLNTKHSMHTKIFFDKMLKHSKDGDAKKTHFHIYIYIDKRS